MRGLLVVVGVGVVLAAGWGRAGAAPRFFVAGDGELALVNAHTGERAQVVYRRADGTYDDEAIGRLRRVLRSRGDGAMGPLPPRFVELLAHLYDHGGRVPLRVLSGYRSPEYNAEVRARGGRAASASLHTEGMAADVAFPKADLEPLWHHVRGLECCGAGYYAKNGFLHVDVGQPRFWEPATSGVEKNLSAENARLFARTDFDAYDAGEPVAVRLHALTTPPVRFRTWLEPSGRIAQPAADAEGCVAADAATRFVVVDVAPIERAPLALVPCEPRPGQTPARVSTNPVTIDVDGVTRTVRTPAEAHR